MEQTTWRIPEGQQAWDWGLRRAAERPGRAEAPGLQSLGLETGRSGCSRMRPPDARDAERAKAAMVGGSLAARLGPLPGLARVA